jgi:hypothetical protein
LPESRSRARTWQDVPLASALVRKTLSSQTMGEDQDSPGISVRQAMFWLGDQVVGRLVSAERPWPVGPRNLGQFSAEVVTAGTQSAQRRRERRIMVGE